MIALWAKALQVGRQALKLILITTPREMSPLIVVHIIAEIILEKREMIVKEIVMIALTVSVAVVIVKMSVVAVGITTEIVATVEIKTGHLITTVAIEIAKEIVPEIEIIE
jgi:hypothetical protein